MPTVVPPNSLKGEFALTHGKKCSPFSFWHRCGVACIHGPRDSSCHRCVHESSLSHNGGALLGTGLPFLGLPSIFPC